MERGAIVNRCYQLKRYSQNVAAVCTALRFYSGMCNHTCIDRDEDIVSVLKHPSKVVWSLESHFEHKFVVVKRVK